MGRSDNRIKIYNKKIESNLSYNLTRVEISKKIDVRLSDFNFFHLKINLPDIYTNDYLYSFTDYNDKTLLAILYAVQCGFPINNLSRRYKDKISNLLSGGNKIEFDVKKIDNVLKKCIWNIFDLEAVFYGIK